tara:strand:- start:7 stop:1725 length:1719 start_codon:yes stop_codon:yes gene_type:complete
MIFLSSLPRSGSTLLASLLNQRPDVYASPTSNLSDTMGAAVQMWEQSPTTKASGGEENDIIRILQGIQNARYDTDKLVFDKGRGWAAQQIIKTMMKVQGDVKIVATVRPVAECLASFAKLMKPENITDFCKRDELTQHLFRSYEIMKAGYKEYPDNFLFIEYDDLVCDPQFQLNRIAEFVGLDSFVHDFDNVEDSKEIDEAWGIEDLHKVRPKVSKSVYSARNLLGDALYNFYQGGEFWNDKPDPISVKQPIHIQHDALMKGDFKKSKQLAYKNLKEFPNDPDIAFNAGWAKLSEGKVAEGYELLDRGRETTVWGDPFQSTQPIWNGEKGTVLLRLERGLGDQLHQVRYARDLKAAGCTVVVSAQSQLAEVISTIPEVDVVVQHEAAAGVYHDYFLPAMSAPIQLGYKTNADLDGTPYIPRPDVDVVPNRAGLRWSGLPAYEHATKRKFPHELLFNTMKNRANCINLQRDDGAEHCPNWVEQVDLSTWTATAKTLASCEFVVTSCTGVAHLAGAMGVPTKVIIPVVPYYLWTYPGSSTPYYDNVSLLRQTKPDDWLAPFLELAGTLETRLAA